MKVRRPIERLRAQFVDSLDFESDEQFRAQMGRLIHRALTLIGTLGPIALAIFMIGQIVFMGKSPALWYDVEAPERVTVVWDKLAMLLVFLSLLLVRRFLPEDRPAFGRLAIGIASIIVVIAITLDDVAARNSQFTPAYVTLLILFLAGAVPMQPISMLTTMGFLVGAGYLSMTLIPPLIGLPHLDLGGEHMIFLVVVAVISVAASALLYNLRHEEFLARKNAEDFSRELEESNIALERAIHDLRTTQDRLVYAEKMASLGRFATGVAHEMRNPLNFVVNFARLSSEILDESDAAGAAHPETDGLRDNLKRIHDHAERAEEIVKSLIAHSQRRSSKSSTVDLNRLITDQTSSLAKRYEPERSGVAVRLSLVLDDAVGEPEALAAELTYALDNIIDNAYRAVVDRALTAETGYEAEIGVSTMRHDGGVRIEVRDNGIGIPDSESGKIFEPFYTTRPAGSGTGLGLASAYATITEGHGGSISVQSEPGAGSVFTIELPDTVSPQGVTRRDSSLRSG